MPYSITHKPKRDIHGISPTMASLETVAATWAFLQHIEASNEIVTTIYDGKEQFLDKNQLQARARDLPTSLLRHLRCLEGSGPLAGPK